MEVHVLPEHFVPVVDAGVTEPDDETSRQQEFAQPKHIARVFGGRLCRVNVFVLGFGVEIARFAG